MHEFTYSFIYITVIRNSFFSSRDVTNKFLGNSPLY